MKPLMGLLNINLLQLLDKIKKNNNIISCYEKDKTVEKTFCQFREDIQKFIEYIRELGLPSKRKIGFLADNSYLVLVGDLGCILGDYHSIFYPESMSASQLKDLINRHPVELMIIQDSYQIKIPDMGNKCKIIGLHELHFLYDMKKTENSRLEHMTNLSEDRSFTTVFTSGTTSLPKAIEISIKPIQRTLGNILSLCHFNQKDKIFIFMPMSHFQQRFFIYGALFFGMHIALSSPQKGIMLFSKVKPTFFIAAPRLYEVIYEQILQKIENLNFFKRIFLKFLMKILLSKYFLEIKEHIGKRLFKDVKKYFGNSVRFLFTGMAPINKDVLIFFKVIGIPLLEAYGLNETGPLTINTINHHRIGSVGQPIPDINVLLDENNQICVKSDLPWSTKYLASDKQDDSQTFLGENLVCTGDIGRFDSEGYLYITGRIKEIIVTSSGKKIHPMHIEKLCYRFPDLHQIVLYGEDRPYIIALAVLKNNTEEVQKKFQEFINQSNTDLAEYEKINRIIFISEDFSIDNGLLTASLKLRRKNIYQKYSDEIKAIYS